MFLCTSCSCGDFRHNDQYRVYLFVQIFCLITIFGQFKKFSNKACVSFGDVICFILTLSLVYQVVWPMVIMIIRNVAKGI